VNKPALLILAAGLGSRYGSLKQIEPVGPHGEAIIDYSVYDAIKAGFGRVVFVIKKEIEADFRESLLPRFESRIETGYVFQELDMLPPGYSLPEGRVKPWGTAHAIMAAENSVSSPFAAINADDFYGYEAFAEMYRFLTTEVSETDYSMVGYKLRNTLSEHGTVSRGVCDIDDNNFLRSVSELTRIRKENSHIVYHEDDSTRFLPEDSIVSMNMWGFSPAVFIHIRKRFSAFLDGNLNDPRAEYFIPMLVDQLIRAGEARVKVLECEASWFGITYREDRESVRKNIMDKIEKGEYPSELWR
jgi:NDP-sugar pyrophosphorylase family protein